MHLAEELFNIPMVVSPDNMCSPLLDELSCMTYLSYFMTENAPGYNSTLYWVKEKISPERVNNFDVSVDESSTPERQCLTQQTAGSSAAW